jgi:[ribosomal protein S5]-alanine N-acetyltransferase
VPDRGDAYFAGFAGRLSELLAWQADGTHFFHVLMEEGKGQYPLPSTFNI